MNENTKQLREEFIKNVAIGQWINDVSLHIDLDKIADWWLERTVPKASIEEAWRNLGRISGNQEYNKIYNQALEDLKTFLTTNREKQ